jgi:hypothetical protein
MMQFHCRTCIECVVAAIVVFVCLESFAPLHQQAETRGEGAGAVQYAPISRASFGVNIYGWLGGDFGGGRTVR